MDCLGWKGIQRPSREQQHHRTWLRRAFELGPLWIVGDNRKY
jgi:hypothetical protein